MSIASFPSDVLINIFELEAPIVSSSSYSPSSSTTWIPTHKGTGFAKYSRVCRNWRLPAQRVLFRRVLLSTKSTDSFHNAIKSNEYLRKSVTNLDLSKVTQVPSGSTLDNRSSIIKLLGPTLLHLTLPGNFNLKDFPYSTFTKLIKLNANFDPPKPPKAAQSYSYGDSDGSDFEEDSDEDLDFDIYDEKFVSKNDDNFKPLLPGSIRLTTLILTTVRPSSEFLNIISSVGSTLINLSLYFQHSIHFQQGAAAFLSTFKTLRRFSYHYNTLFTTPSRLLEYILPRFKSLEVLSIYGDLLPTNILVIIPDSLKYLEIDDMGIDINFSTLVKPLRITPSKVSMLKKIVIMHEDADDILYDYKSEIKFLKSRKVSVDISHKLLEQSAFFELYA